MRQRSARASDAAALMREAEQWRDLLGADPEAGLPLLIGWTAWRWAEAAARLSHGAGRANAEVPRLTLLAHARCLLDLLDAGHIDAAVALHRTTTGGADRLDAQRADDPAFARWCTADRAPSPFARLLGAR